MRITGISNWVQLQGNDADGVAVHAYEYAWIHACTMDRPPWDASAPSLQPSIHGFARDDQACCDNDICPMQGTASITCSHSNGCCRATGTPATSICPCKAIATSPPRCFRFSTLCIPEPHIFTKSKNQELYLACCVKPYRKHNIRGSKE